MICRWTDCGPDASQNHGVESSISTNAEEGARLRSPHDEASEAEDPIRDTGGTYEPPAQVTQQLPSARHGTSHLEKNQHYDTVTDSYSPQPRIDPAFDKVHQTQTPPNSMRTAPVAHLPTQCSPPSSSARGVTVSTDTQTQHITDHYLDGTGVSARDGSMELSAISPPVSTAATQSSHHSDSTHVWQVLPKHLPATCPLDQILLDFLNSRRAMAASSTTIESLLGPEQPSIKAMLNPELATMVHPLSRVMSEVLSTFAHVKLPEKIAFMYLMHGTMRVSLTASPY